MSQQVFTTKDIEAAVSLAALVDPATITGLDREGMIAVIYKCRQVTEQRGDTRIVKPFVLQMTRST